MSFRFEALKCDICGKTVEAAGCPAMDTRFDRVHKTYDMCQPCGKELADWIMARFRGGQK